MSTSHSFTTYERLWASAEGTQQLGAHLARTSRAVRRERPAGLDRHRSSLWDIGAQVVGPMLAAFCQWTFRHALSRDERRLLFLSREGQVIHQFAGALLPRTGLPLTARYLHVSRQGTNLAALEEVTGDELGWLWTHGGTNLLGTLLRRAGLDPDETLSDLDHLDVAAVPDDAARRDLAAVLGADPLADRIRDAAARSRAIVLPYLERAGGLAPGKVAIVDASGSGSQVRTLLRLRARRGLQGGHGYLFVREVATVGDAPPVVGYLEDPENGTRGFSTPENVALVESFFAADHGTVLGYRVEGGDATPVLADHAVAERRTWGIGVVHRAVRRFAELMEPGEQDWSADIDLRPTLGHVLSRFRDHPSHRHARAWGSFPFEAGSGTDAPLVPLASPLSVKDLATAARRGSLATGDWYRWNRGAVAMSSAPVRVTASVARRLRRP